MTSLHLGMDLLPSAANLLHRLLTENGHANNHPKRHTQLVPQYRQHLNCNQFSLSSISPLSAECQTAAAAVLGIATVSYCCLRLVETLPIDWLQADRY